jgi:UDP-N-acetylglucosamine 1-carboxyvinyltransferase
VKAGFVEMKADQLKGAQINLRFASVGATENILLAAVLAHGKTVINNAACEPEIADLANMLNKMGSQISGAGTQSITVDGVDSLHGAAHSVIPDRIETATYLIGAAITQGDVTLNMSEPRHLKTVIQKLESAGMEISIGNGEIHAKWVKALSPISVKTDVYPGFPTDVQAQWMALMATVPGTAKIEESVFENRMLHAVELQRLGADITIDGNRVTTCGVKKLSGAPVMASDLRAGAGLVLAGLVAEGKTEINRVYHLDRGYENLESKLRSLGASIRRVSD